MTCGKIILPIPAQVQTKKKLDAYLWRSYLYPSFGVERPETIKSLSVLLFKNKLLQTLSPQTTNHCLSLLRRIFKKNQMWDLYRGEIPHFDMPKFDNRRIRFLTPEEVDVLLFQLRSRSELWHDISIFALHTGLRSKEIFNLQKHCINLTERTAYILDSKSTQNRAIPLNKVAYAICQKYLRKRSPYLFTGQNEKMIRFVSKTFFRTIHDCGLNSGVTDRRQRVVFHTLRHTFASWLVQAGHSLTLVGELLGHKTPQMTKRYAHLSPKHGRAAVSDLDDIGFHVNGF